MGKKSPQLAPRPFCMQPLHLTSIAACSRCILCISSCICAIAQSLSRITPWSTAFSARSWSGTGTPRNHAVREVPEVPKVPEVEDALRVRGKR
eukprot:5390208-Pleurochrysis_carterae.AAC.2